MFTTISEIVFILLEGFYIILAYSIICNKRRFVFTYKLRTSFFVVIYTLLHIGLAFFPCRNTYHCYLLLCVFIVYGFVFGFILESSNKTGPCNCPDVNYWDSAYTGIAGSNTPIYFGFNPKWYYYIYYGAYYQSIARNSIIVSLFKEIQNRMVKWFKTRTAQISPVAYFNINVFFIRSSNEFLWRI